MDSPSAVTLGIPSYLATDIDFAGHWIILMTTQCLMPIILITCALLGWLSVTASSQQF